MNKSSYLGTGIVVFSLFVLVEYTLRLWVLFGSGQAAVHFDSLIAAGQMYTLIVGISYDVLQLLFCIVGVAVGVWMIRKERTPKYLLPLLFAYPGMHLMFFLLYLPLGKYLYLNAIAALVGMGLLYKYRDAIRGRME